MNKELYVSSTPHETKVALVEDDQLAEVFFERENEYTLAGSIYKGRVTRVLPGMQSAFVDIGLERDAFLYVSDFLELQGDEDEDEDFGEIPAPRGAIELGKPQPSQESNSEEAHTASSPASGADDAELEPMFEEEAPSPIEGQAEAGESEEQESGDGARRWRGRRRRRGGRRGRGGVEREARSESGTETTEASEEAAQPHAEARPRFESRPRQEYGPPAGYTPIVLPGESISKYRNMTPAAEAHSDAEETAAAPVEDFTPAEQAHADTAVQSEISDEAVHLDQGFSVDESAQQEVQAAETPSSTEAASSEEEPRSFRGRWWRSRRKSSARPEESTRRSAETTPAESHATASAGANAEESVNEAENSNKAESAEAHTQDEHQKEYSSTEPYSAEQQDPGTLSSETGLAAQDERHAVVREEHEHEVDTPAGSFELTETETQHFAPSIAPEGRTLEHEVLEEEEMDFQPMPEDVSAMREVAGDEELVLEEETLDAGNGYSERWVPKIEDVDEDEIVAAEERGEKLYAAEEEEDEEANSEEEEVAERAELRATAPTAGYQQRTQRSGYERGRGYRDRGRRGGGRRGLRPRNGGNRHQPLITDLLKEGQEVLIQIAKEPIGKKGARITSHIALPGRFLVYMPTVNHVGVSRKISSDEERQRLKRIVTSERENGLGGFIVRTAAVNIKEEDLRADIRFLKHLWAEIKNRAENSKSPALIYHDLNLVERVLRDQVNADFSQIWVDTEDEYERVVRFANRFQPSLVRRIKLYTKDTPLFEQFGIQDEINRSLKSKVWLKSGVSLV